MTPVAPETAVPPDESPAARCPYCDRPFRTERSCALHAGECHAEALTEADAEAYEQAQEDEEEALFYFHMKVFIALGAIHGVLVLLYMIAFGSGLI